MVNSVGSCENKKWTKKWKRIKPNLILTKEQKSVIIGSLLGDGTMRIGKGAINANLKIEQGIEQKAYVMWKYKFLKPWVFTKPKLSYRYDSKRNKYPKSRWFRTIRHPVLTEIYHQFYTSNGYLTGRKIIPSSLDLNPLTLAIWIMDDGSKTGNQIDISTHSFQLQEIKLLQGILTSRYEINTRYREDSGRGYRLFCASKEDTEKLTSVISPYIIPSMEYKINSR